MISTALLRHAAQHIDGNEHARSAIVRVVARFGEQLVHFVFAQGVRIYALRPGEDFATASPVIARDARAIADRRHAPAGLFVVAEKTAYLRTITPMSIAHEFAHGVDCAVGGGRYFSEQSPLVRAAFAAAERFVTPYAAVGIDEYFAENTRAFLGINDAQSPWPKVSRVKLRRYDLAMHDVISSIFIEPQTIAAHEQCAASCDMHGS